MRISVSVSNQVYTITIRDDKNDPFMDISNDGLFKGRENELEGVDEL